MKKLISQISIGLIFIMFGFVIMTQFNSITRQSVNNSSDELNPDILVENEQLQKDKEELQKQVEDLTKKADEFENAAASNTENEKIYDELKKTRLRAGLTDVQGQGIIVYINQKTSIVTSGSKAYNVEDYDLLKLVNELFAAGAEAISINDIRLTGYSGIRTAANIYIYINNERISAQSQIVVKAIGNKSVLENVMKFPGVIPPTLATNCDVTYETKDEIVINKSNNISDFEYIREVKDVKEN